MFSSHDSEQTSAKFSGLLDQRFATDLSLDDFRDEDLKDITEEDTLKYSLVNGRFKSDEARLSPRQISDHMKKISPNLVQLDLMVKTCAGDFDGKGDHLERPQTLNIFSAMTHEVFDRVDLVGEKKEKLAHLLGEGDFMECVPPESGRRRMNCARSIEKSTITQHHPTWNTSEWSVEDPGSVDCCYLNGKMKRQTHVAAFKFVPRHSDEVHLDIYDPLHVNQQGDDLWFEGLNMRTGEHGYFPSYYAQSIHSSNDDSPKSEDDSWKKFFLYFIGSVEVPCHKGSDMLCQAMYKVAEARRTIFRLSPPTYVCLIVGARGVKIMNQSELKHFKSGKHSGEEGSFSSSGKVKQETHFFELKNVSFCGHHPGDEKYFGFITRHPNEYRFACHTFICERSTRPIIDCFGLNFEKHSKEYIQPQADMYLE